MDSVVVNAGITSEESEEKHCEKIHHKSRPLRSEPPGPSSGLAMPAYARSKRRTLNSGDGDVKGVEPGVDENATVGIGEVEKSKVAPDTGVIEKAAVENGIGVMDTPAVENGIGVMDNPKVENGSGVDEKATVGTGCTLGADSEVRGELPAIVVTVATPEDEMTINLTTEKRTPAVSAWRKVDEERHRKQYGSYNQRHYPRFESGNRISLTTTAVDPSSLREMEIGDRNDADVPTPSAAKTL